MYCKVSPRLVQPVVARRHSAAAPAEDVHPLPSSGSPRTEETAPLRQELVARVRQEIAAGEYDTPEKWEAALDRMLGRLQLV